MRMNNLKNKENVKSRIYFSNFIPNRKERKKTFIDTNYPFN